MTAASLSLCFGLAAALLHVVMVPVAIRRLRHVAPVTLHVLSGLLAHLAQICAMLLYGIQNGVALPYWHGAAVFGGVSAGYVFAFSAVYKSVSLRILAQTIKAGGQLNVEEVESRLIRPEFLDRVGILAAAGLVSASANAYRIAAAGLTLAGRLRALQRLFGVSRSGLY